MPALREPGLDEVREACSVRNGGAEPRSHTRAELAPDIVHPGHPASTTPVLALPNNLVSDASLPPFKDEQTNTQRSSATCQRPPFRNPSDLVLVFFLPLRGPWPRATAK